ncbi:DTW domain-containing protein [Vibrio sp. 99-70-13A1]|uniref:tRNA-uridine aminocarboxypropyltransferase n=1 Tax=Vibrio sp. 99-70-13A1 TaxID=2607601 RepID=UPI00149355F5|nr:DTW domain-containing protein [Vibrio sp. 99-70-13A1]NOH96480.1 DTW domain-containing protein [Vibrio sp. 99-70-13A1]
MQEPQVRQEEQALKACTGCGFKHQCICDQKPQVDSSIDLVLLTHENELSRETNTGKLLNQTLENCHVYTWQRKEPPAELLHKIAQPEFQAFVLFPSETSQPCQQAIKNLPASKNQIQPIFIMLDGTWQEAKKMLNKSSWLKALPAIHLQTNQDSMYTLRRNQEAGHLCTCEVGIQLLRELDQEQQADQIERYFAQYLQMYKADKCGHKLK